MYFILLLLLLEISASLSPPAIEYQSKYCSMTLLARQPKKLGKVGN